MEEEEVAAEEGGEAEKESVAVEDGVDAETECVVAEDDEENDAAKGCVEEDGTVVVDAIKASGMTMRR